MEKTKKEEEGGLEDTKKERKVRMEGLKKDGEGGLEERKKEKEAHNVVNLTFPKAKAIDNINQLSTLQRKKLEWRC